MLFYVWHLDYNKTCVKRPLSKNGFQDWLLLNAGRKYCRMPLQYFQPSLSYHLSLRYCFYLFLSGFFTQVLLYAKMCEEYLRSVGGTISLSSLSFKGKGLPYVVMRSISLLSPSTTLYVSQSTRISVKNNASNFKLKVYNKSLWVFCDLQSHCVFPSQHEYLVKTM